MESSAKYTANTGVAEVSVANAKLNGTGTVATILTAASNGTLIKTVSIKSEVALDAGNIIRLFVYDGASTFLLKEILIRPTGGGAGSVFSTFSTTIPLNFPLKSGYILMASTDLAKKTSIIAEGLDWAY